MPLHGKNTRLTDQWTVEPKDPQEMMQVRQETLELAMEVLYSLMGDGQDGHGLPEMPFCH